MEINRETPVESSYSREPYIGMPIYIDEDAGEYSYMANETAEPNVEKARNDAKTEQLDDDTERYCRDAEFEMWPLAMAYVPWQRFTEPSDPEIAFEEGTIFSDLNLPFLGDGSTMGGARR